MSSIRLVLVLCSLLSCGVARAEVALIQSVPPAIVEIHGDCPCNVNVPGKWQVNGVGLGWQSPDGAYALVTVTPFQIPAGQQTVGAPSYAFDGQGNVVQSYATQAAPAAVPQVTSLAFYNLFTTNEQVAIAALAQTDPQVQLFMTRAAAAGLINLSDPQVMQGLSYLVAKNVLTQARATAIEAGTAP